MLFLTISGFAMALIFLRAGARTQRGELPDFSWDRYWPALSQYLNHLLHGTWGFVYLEPPLKGGAPLPSPVGTTVGSLVWTNMPVSLTLFFSALAAGVILGLLGGLFASRFARPWVRRSAGAANLLFLSIPDLLLIFFVQWGLMKLGQATGWMLLPPYGNWQGGLTLRTAILPVLMLAMFPAAYVARMSAAAFDNIFGTDYIRTARSKGVPAHRITWGHALRNAMLPILAGIPTISGIMMSNLVIVEYAMNVVGVGWLAAWQIVVPNRPVLTLPYPSPNILASIAICLAALFVLIDLVTDLVLLWLDPMARTARQEQENVAAAQLEAAPRGSWRAGFVDLWQALADAVRSIRLPGRDFWHRLALAYRGNLPLIFGTAITGFLVLVAIFADVISPFGVDEIVPVIPTKNSYLIPPYPPGTGGFILGSDNIGRDVLTRVIHGTRYTLLIAMIIVPLRMLVAVPLGLAAGWLRGRWESFVTWTATVLGAMPATIIIVLMIMTIFAPPRPGSIYNPVHPEPPAVVILLLNCIILVLIGWPRMAESIRLMARELAARPFIEGARAVGAGPARLMLRHILPHLGPSLAVAAAAEVAWVMMLLVHIGTFGAWLGGSTAYERERVLGQALVSRFPDWSQMLDLPQKTFWLSPWVLITPAIAFVVAIFGFNLLAEGIRRAQQRFSA